MYIYAAHPHVVHTCMHTYIDDYQSIVHVHAEVHPYSVSNQIFNSISMIVRCSSVIESDGETCVFGRKQEGRETLFGVERIMAQLD